MSLDAFIKIDGIPGESTDKKHQDWISVRSYSIGVEQKTSSYKHDQGGAPVGRAEFDDLTITKGVDIASPLLFKACAKGTHIKEIIMQLHRAGGDKVLYMEYKLTNSIISSWKPYGDEEHPMSVETVSFNPGKIELVYSQQNREGIPTKNISAGWDLEANYEI